MDRFREAVDIFDPNGPGFDHFMHGASIHWPEAYQGGPAGHYLKQFERLPDDPYFSDDPSEGRRQRRHLHYVIDRRIWGGEPMALPHIANFQLDDKKDNTYVGVERRFESITVANSPYLKGLIMDIRKRYMEALGDSLLLTVVQFRTVAPASGKVVKASDGGPHQDGFSALSLTIHHRDEHLIGGNSQIYEDDGSGRPKSEPVFDAEIWDPGHTIVVNDKTMFHHATEMQSGWVGRTAERRMTIIDWQPIEEITVGLRQELVGLMDEDGWVKPEKSSRIYVRRALEAA